MIREKITKFLELWPDAEYGPAHVVLSDYNLEDYFVDASIQRIRNGDRSSDELSATLSFLLELRDIPEDKRIAEFDDEED